MKDYLSKAGNLLLVLGIYVYFSAWVYVHSFYGHFGVSPATLGIDYSAYLVFSFNVFISKPFLVALGVFAVLGLVRMGLAIAHWKAPSFLTRFRLVWLLAFMVLLFPWLFYVAQTAAWNDYTNERLNKGTLRSVQFVFRKDSDVLYPAQVLDTAGQAGQDLLQDLRLLKNDSTRLLKLLGESDAYYIVLSQRPVDPVVGALPIGFVYFVDKKDVLLAKITLSSL
ncbi:hypothetical protein [Dinghuibacter silviterrae]|uniref:Uncharacterized protein n=1 Tax=Dinghuibacter silviterrae TaxID=1539049 RepID=A0A4R8DTG2_9BACT|nr:hypothetical protein [Dinghuibacter silviterrae]TDX01570.1 hypothetical protein EDB95_2610 [Dinghuibacter silviterrae]